MSVLSHARRGKSDRLLAHANVRQQQGAVVEGVLYQLTAPAQILDMDPFEGHPEAYRREVCTIATEEGALSGWVYIAPVENTDDNCLPAREYLDHLLAGRDYLSDDYYRRLCAQPCVDELDRRSLTMLGIYAGTQR
ncbi:gamma-glutamylcyclotransferase family protein [Kushneria aurantia]|nr:gamma-glutamylcyclotransferase family protein [Kushneria aurantia]